MRRLRERKAEVAVATLFVGFLFIPFIDIMGREWWVDLVLLVAFIVLVERLSNGFASLR